MKRLNDMQEFIIISRWEDACLLFFVPLEIIAYSYKGDTIVGDVLQM